MEDPPFAPRLEAAARWLEVSPAEAVGLLLLALGGVLVAALVWWRSQPVVEPSVVAIPTATATTDASTDDVVVHVTGEVVRPGLVTLGDGARVADAIDAAGGVRDGAQVDLLNLAREVVDGEQIRVPGAGDEVGEAGIAPGSGGMLPDGRVDLNRATASDLQTLPGVGPVLAERIVAHREASGAFQSPGDLRQVSGIGEKTFQTLADLVVVP